MKANTRIDTIEPSRFRARCAAACLLALALLLAAGAAGAQTSIELVSNTGQSSSSSTNLSRDFAQAFTTGSHNSGYRLTSVNIEFSFASSGTQPGYKVRIQGDADGSPDPAVNFGTLTNPASLKRGVNSFKALDDGLLLSADTTYWLVIDASGETSTSIQFTASDSETGESDWSIADLFYSREYGSTGSWDGYISGDALKIAVRGHKAPDKRMPMFSSASVNGTTLEMTFDEALDAGSAPAGSAFTVSATPEGGSARNIAGTGTASIDGMTATVTLADAVSHGETVTVSYAKPASNPLRDPAENEAAGFSGKEADNDTPAPMFSSASVNATTLTVTFDLALDTGSAPAGSAFTVSATPEGGAERNIAGTGTAAVADMTATVTLAGAVAHGETVTVSYTAPASNPLQGAAGNDALSFTDRPAANDTPDTTPPAVTGVTVYGNTLTVTFDEALDAGSKPAGSEFSVSATPEGGTARAIAGTGTAVVAGMTATVTLAGAVAHGETVTASYTKPASNPLRDPAENEAAGFSGRAAANATPAEPDTTPPVLWDATVQGSVFVLTYSETLDPSHTPSLDRYDVKVNVNPNRDLPRQSRDVIDVEIRGNLVVLTLASAVAEGRKLWMAYNEPGRTSAIQDYAGNLAGSLSERRLTLDDTFPRLVAATVRGAVLTLTYDENLNPNSVPHPREFLVYRTFSHNDNLRERSISVTRVRVRGRAVVLALARAVDPETDTVRVNYRPGGGISDLAGNLAPGIPYMLVTHGPPPTTQTPPPPPGSGGRPGFGDASVADLTLTAGRAMRPVTLPAATGGDGALTYTLTSHLADLAGLSFNARTRRLSGTPDAAGGYRFTYTAHDADEDRSVADAAVLNFSIIVETATAGSTRSAVRNILRQSLGALGTRTLTGVLAGVNARFADAAPETGMRLAGREVLPFGAAPAVLEHACPAERYERPVHERAALGACGAAGITSEELMRASAFTWTPASADGGEASDAPLWAVWGRGDFGSFEGRPEEGSRYEGDTRTGWLGFDMRRGPWVAGVALAHGRSEADYGVEAGASIRGRLETTLTALYPYGRWRFSNGLEVRLVVGAGAGEARHVMEEEPEETGDLDMRMASVGLRREFARSGGFGLAVRADASFVRMEVEAGPATISGVSADTRRLRLGLEASRRLELGGGAALTPFVEAAARRDGGDGLTGSGVEIAGGVRYASARFQVEARGRWLAAHSEDDAREQGVSVTVRLGPGAQGRGLSFALTPRWGAPAGGAEALWREEMPRLPAGSDEAAVDARVGYGFAWDARGLVTPFAETSAGGGSSRLRLGTRFEASGADLAMELAGERTEREGDPKPVHGARLDVSYRF